jgi:4-hydroxy-tetrahydrodipicolinate synthase
MIDLSGTGVALITPFQSNGKIDKTALQNMVRHVAQGVDYVVALGTTGESATLSAEEKKMVLKTIREALAGSKPLILGLGGNHTDKLLEELKETDLTGVDAILSVTPYYNKPSQEGLIRHYQMLSDASPVPIVLYNVPGRTGTNLSAATTLELALHPNIIGTKEASGNVEQCMAIAAGMPTGFTLISGDDLLTPALISIGAKGVISVLANAWPREFSAMVGHCLNRDFEGASGFWKNWLKLNPLLYEEGNPVGIKAVLSLIGLCEGQVRLPLMPASKELKAKIREHLDS